MPQDHRAFESVRPRAAARMVPVVLLLLGGCVLSDRGQRPAPPAAIAPREREESLGSVILVKFEKPADELPLPRKAPAEDEESSRDRKDRTTSAPERPTARVRLTLDQVIQTCLLADPKLHAGLEAIAQSQADLLTSSLKPNPEIYTDIQLLPLFRPFTVERTGGPPQFDFQVGYPIDWLLFGKRAAAMLAADQRVRVSEAEFADLIRERVTEAGVAFYDVLESKELVEVARQDLDSFTRLEKSLKEAVKEGGRPRVELERIGLDALRSQQILREAEANLLKAKIRLRALLGRVDCDPGFDVEGALEVGEPGEAPCGDDAFDLAQEHRPDIQALRWKLGSAQAEVEVEDRKACPDVKPLIAYTHQFQRKPIGQPDADSYTLALSSTLPVCNRNQGNRLKARSALAQAHWEYQQGLVELRAELEQSLLDYRTTARIARSVAGEQIRLARTVRDSIQTAYDAGGRTLLDFLDAQRTYRETYRLSITSRAAYWRAVVRLNAALGKQVVPHVHTPPRPSSLPTPR